MMNNLLLRFESQFSRINSSLDELRHPAKVEELNAVEKELGAVLPDDFRQFYLWHDGQKGVLFLYGEYRLYSLSTVLEANKADWGKENPKWIQFGDNGGNTVLLVNLDSANKDATGEIFEYSEDGVECAYAGIKEFLECTIQRIESGEIVWDEQAGLFSSLDCAPGSAQSLLRERVQAVDESLSAGDLSMEKIGEHLALVGLLKPNFKTNKHMLYIRGGAIQVQGDIGNIKLSSRSDYPLVRINVRVDKKNILFGLGKIVYKVMSCELLRMKSEE